MIPSTQQQLTLPVPLTLTEHHTAQMFYQKHPDNPHKAKQVYLNTLAVEAVRTYLGWLGIASNPQASDSWDPIIQTLADVADLEILGQGKLECRPVLPGAATCYIPPETCSDRIGYLPVLFNAELTTATLLGFIPSANVTIETEEVPLTSLASIGLLFEHLNWQPEATSQRVCLGQWLKETAQKGWHGWQTVESLFGPQPEFSFRSLELSTPADRTGAAIRGKIIELAPLAASQTNDLPSGDLPNGFWLNDYQLSDTLALEHQTSCPVALVVGIAPSDALQSNIFVKICPVGGDRYLPEALEVRVLDDQETVVMEAQSRQTDMLQLNFRGMLSERFAVEVALNGVSLVERFII